MPLNPQFLAARAAEQRQRFLTHLTLPPPFRLPTRSGVAVIQLAHYTERHHLELQLVGNPLAHAAPCPADPTSARAALFQFLWRQHPLFYRPSDDTFPNRRSAPGWATPLRAWLAYRAVARAVRAALLPLAYAEAARIVATSEQDLPAEPLDAPPAPAAPPRHRTDDLVDYVSTQWHIPPRDVLDYPRALLWQLHRNRLLAQPDGAEYVIDPSDALLAG